VRDFGLTLTLAIKKLRIVAFGFGAGRQKMVLGRWTNLKRSPCTCTCEYGLQSCRGKSADVAKRPRERFQLIQLLHAVLDPALINAAAAAADVTKPAESPRGSGKKGGMSTENVTILVACLAIGGVLIIFMAVWYWRHTRLVEEQDVEDATAAAP
jgi:hypothetical protein